jgi:hypothetical protein
MEQKPLKHACRAVGNEFFTTAPIKFQNSIILPVSSEVAFKILEDASSWPVWFKDVKEISWKTPKPFGVGTRRVATLAFCEVYEQYFNWETNKRVSFCALSHNSIAFKLVNAIAEDYVFEDLPDGRCHYTHIVAMELSWFLWITWPISYFIFASMFSGASHGLEKYCAQRVSNPKLD